MSPASRQMARDAVRSTLPFKVMGTFGDFYGFVGTVFKQMFTRRFHFREFISQAWFITTVSFWPAMLVAIPFCVVIIFQVNQLLIQIGAVDLAGMDIVEVSPPCPLAQRWFGDGKVPGDIRVEGRPASIEQATRIGDIGVAGCWALNDAAHVSSSVNTVIVCFILTVLQRLRESAARVRVRHTRGTSVRTCPVGHASNDAGRPSGCAQ